MKKQVLFTLFSILTISFLNPISCFSQLTEWESKVPVEIQEIANDDKFNYQVLLKLNTQTLIGAGQMKADGSDLRFAEDCEGNNELNFFVESGMNTDSTQIWVMLPVLDANTTATIFMFYGNPAATDASSFDNTFPPDSRLIVPAGTVTLAGTNNYSWVQVDAGATITGNEATLLTINARKIIIDGTINLTGSGYLGANPALFAGGPGGGNDGNSAGGGGYGGAGGIGASQSTQTPGTGGNPNGNATTDAIDWGSGGGASLAIGGSNGGNGGGQINLTARVLEIAGSVIADGDPGESSGSSYSGGGGSGGGIRIKGQDLVLSGHIQTNGGNGGENNDLLLCVWGGGGGSGGRIKIFHEDNYINTGTAESLGGAAGQNFGSCTTDPGTGTTPADPGKNGSVADGLTTNLLEPVVTILTSTSVTSSSTDASCSGGCDGTATMTATGTNTPYTYIWDDPSTQTTSTATALCAGPYNGTTTDSYGCPFEESVTVSGPAPITVTTSVTDAGCGLNTGTATAMPTGGSGNFTYQWDAATGNQTTQTANNLGAGTYSVTVTDDTGCSETATAAINDVGGPTINITTTDVTCNGDNDGTSTAIPSGGLTPYDYQWDAAAANQITQTATGLDGGAYSVTVTDFAGCTGTAVATVTEPNPLSVVMTADDETCSYADGEATATPSGGTTAYGYQWDANANNQITQTATGLSAGEYHVTITDASNCTVTNSVSVSTSSGIGLAASSSAATCNGASDGTAQVTVVTPFFPPYTYLWNDANAQTTQLATGLAAGSYTVTVYEGLTGCEDSISINVNEPAEIILDVDSTDVTCNGADDGTATVYASGGGGGFTYLWDANAGSQVSQTATGLAGNTYSITVTDADACRKDTIVTVNEPTAITLTESSTDETCAGNCDGTASVAVSGGVSPYIYQWSNGATTDSQTGLCANTYSVSVADQNACFEVATVTVSSSGGFSVTVTSTDVSCGGANSGTATATATGGGSPLTYNWSSGQTTATITGLGVGVYTATVTETGGCTQSGSATVSDPGNMTITMSGNEDFCNNQSGDATATPTGGSTPYTYVWNDGQNTQTATGLGKGKYYVTVSDNSGCAEIDSIFIDNDSDMSFSRITSNVSCYGASDGEATVIATNPFPPYTYQWNDPNSQTTQTASGLSGGTFTVTVTDFTGCSDTTAFTITEPTEIVTSIASVTDVVCNGASTGAIDLEVTGGESPYDYTWDNGAGTNQDPSGIPAGVYTVIVEDNNFCTVTESATVTESPAITLTVNGVDETCGAICDGSASTSVSGGVSPLSYLWSNNETTSTVTGLCANTYTVTVTDDDGCSTNESVTIDPAGGITISASSTDVSCGSGNDGTATVNVSGGAAPYDYLWDDASSQTTASISGLTAGVYTVTVTENGGCQATASTTVNDNGNITITMSSNDELCDLEDGDATATVTGGGTPYTYIWDDPSNQTTPTATGLAEGTYSVTVSDATGCVESNTVSVGNQSDMGFSRTWNDASCFGASDGDATVIATNLFPPYTYLWDDPQSQTTLQATGLGAGTYTVTVTDNTGCSDTTSFVIDEPTEIVTTIVSVTNVDCNGASTGAIDLDVTGGASGYTYAWDNGAGTNQDPSNIPAGNYTVVVTDNSGCTVTDAATVTEPSAITPTIQSVNDVACNGDANGSIDLEVAGGTTNYTYAWNNGAGTSQDPSGLSGGVYTVTVTDANGCTANESATVTEPASITATVVATNDASCNGGTDGSIDLEVMGGTTNYSYSWDSGASNVQDPSGLSAGTYNVTVIDANGCTANTSASISEPSSISLSASSVDASCSSVCDGEGSVTATGGTTNYTYAWSDPGSQASATATGLCSGSYTVTVTDANGCEETTSISVSEPTGVTAALVSVTDADCNGASTGAVDIDVTGGTTAYTYAWDNGASTEDLSSVAAGTYNLTVTDANGCTDNLSATVNEPAAITTTIASTSDVSCNGNSDGSVDLEVVGGTGAYTYAWDNGSTSQDLSNVMAGTYNVTVTDNNGCTATESATVNEPAQAMALTVTNSDASCNGECDGSASVSVSGGTTAYAYLWNDGASQNTSSATGLCAGNYMVTVTDANGCTATESATIGEPSAITVNTTTTDPACGATDGTATAMVSGGGTSYTYLWDNGQATQTATGLGAGSYSVTVTDNTGCTTSGSALLSNPGAPTANATSTSVTCNGGVDGTATVAASGGSTPYTYLWDDVANQTTPTATGLGMGTYNVTIEDNSGCEAVAQTDVTEPTDIVTTIVTADPSCSGDNDATATANASGGQGTYSYAWDDGQTTQTAVGLTSGSYTVTVTDSNGCTDVMSTTITDPAGLSVSVNGTTNVDCFGGNTGAIDLDVSGGTSPYSYTWDNGAPSVEDPTGLMAGIYSVMVADASGCEGIASATISEPSAISITVANTTPTSCNSSGDGAIDIEVAGGTAAYDYAWSSGETTQDISNINDGTYTVTVTDNNGCIETESVTISSPNSIVLTIVSVTDVDCNGNANGTIDLDVTGGTTAYSYNWSNTATTQDISSLSGGTYDVTVTDANGCEETTSVTVDEPTTLAATIVAVSDVSCEGNADGSINLGVSGGATAYSFDWDNGAADVEDPNGLAAGTYNVTITDANGCTANQSATITEPNSTLVVQVVGVTNVDCNGGSDGAIALDVSGGTTNYTYAWDNGAGNSKDPSGLMAGTYTVTVTDANGCMENATATVTEPSAITTNIVAVSQISCGGANTGAIDLEVTGGNTTYSYNWSNGDNTQDISNLAAGTYTVVVTDANGCTANESATVTEPSSITLTAVASDASCNGQATGTVDATVTGGTPNYTFNWSNGATSEDLSNVAAGTYDLTVTDANGCTETTSATVGEPSLISVTTNTSPTSGCGAADGTVSANGSGGSSSTYTYNWSNGGITQTITGLVAGTYQVTVSGGGCSGIGSGVVSDPGGVTITGITETNSIDCNGDGDGAAMVSVTGGASAYTYEWSNGATDATISGLSAGSYDVTVTSGSCTSFDNVVISEPDAIMLATSSTNECATGTNDGTATVNVTGGTPTYTYMWDGSSNQTTASATGLVAGTYTVTVSDNNGCGPEVAMVTVSGNQALSTTVTNTNLTCNGDNDAVASVMADGGSQSYNYAWSNGAITASISGLSGGTYYVTVTDNSCGITSVESVTVTEPTMVSLLTNGTNVSCNGGSTGILSSFVSGGTSPYTFDWSTGVTTASITGLSANTYSLTVADANGCGTNASYVITEPSAITVSVSSTDPTTCGGADGTATASGSGGPSGTYSYLWQDGQTGPTATGLVAGFHAVTVTSGSCSETGTATLVDPSGITLSTSVTPVNCNGGSNGTATVNVSGGSTALTYIWSNGTTVATATGLVAGTHTVTVSSGGGACSDFAMVTITEPSSISTSDVTTEVSCNGSSDGSIDLTVSGGAAGFQFTWSNGSNNEDVSGLGAGVYTVTLSDINGCFATHSATVTEPTPLVVDVNCTPESVSGASDGASSAAATGGKIGYQYLWNNGETLQTITGLTAGQIRVTVTDANGCQASDDCTIVSDPCANAAASATSTNVTCNGAEDGAAAATLTGGFSSTYVYLWSTGATSPIVVGLDAGTYSVTIIDGSGCSGTAGVTITEPAAMDVTITGANPTCPGAGVDGTAMVMTTGGPDSNYSYNWSNGSDSSSAEALIEGWHFVTVTSGVCAKEDSIMLTMPQPDSVSMNVSICEGTSYFAGGANQTQGGTYFDTYSNMIGCDSVVTTILSIDSLPTATASANADTVCNGASVQLQATGGTSYQWNNANTLDDALIANPTATITGNTFYIVTVTENGCSSTASVVVNASQLPSITYTEDIEDCTDSITVNAPGATSYTWITPTGTINTTNNVFVVQMYSQSQDFEVTAHDAIGCSSTETITVVAVLSCPAVGIEEEKASNVISIYPNPTRGNVVLEIMNYELNDNAEVTIANAVGQVVYQSSISNSTLNISLNQPSGVYFMNVQLNDKVITKRLTISK